MDSLTREPIKVQKRGWLGRLTMAVLCLAVLGATVFAIWFWPAGLMGGAATAARTRPSFPIPVLQAVATTRDVPIWLDGLGTVQASANVVIKPMVDGPLIAVHFTEGATVRKGEVLARIDPRAYRAALDNVIAKKAQNDATLANARLDLARYQKLVASNYTSAQQADTARTLVAQLEAVVRQDQAAIETAQTNLDYTTIVAPIDGRVGMRMIDTGNIVRASDATGLTTVAALQPISVVFTLAQQALPMVARAMRAGTPTVLALSQGEGSTSSRLLDTGTLTVLDNAVDAATGTIRLKARFQNADSTLWHGGFVAARLQVDLARDAIVVPPAAVQRGPRGSFVFVIGAENIVSRRAVVLGFEDELASIVTDGLKAGERVVIDGASRLSDGSKVVIAQDPSGATPPGARPATAPGTGRRPAAGG